MPVNLALGHVSNDFLIAALVIYSLSVVAFAGDFAFGRPRRAAASGPQAQQRAAALAAVGAAGAAISVAPGSDGAPADGTGGPAAAGPAPAVPDSMPEVALPRCARWPRPAGGSRWPWRSPRPARWRTLWPS